MSAVYPTQPSEVENPVGDTDVAEVPEGTHKGEVPQPVIAGNWVLLGRRAKDHAGKIGVILDSPWKAAPIGVPTTVHGYTFDPDGKFTVRVRDETDAIIVVSDAAIVKVATTRTALLNYA